MVHDKRKVRIGGQELEAWYSDEPVSGYSYNIEANGDRDNEFGQCFLLPYFKSVEGSEIPDDLKLSILYTSSHFKRVNFVEVKKKCSCLLSIILCIDHVDWEMPESVGNFVDRYVQAIKNQGHFNAYPDRTEYGYFVHCELKLHDDQSIYDQYLDFEHRLESLYRKAFLKRSEEDVGKGTYGESRLHWWIRYVVVPLAGSGTIAAVLGNYLLK